MSSTSCVVVGQHVGCATSIRSRWIAQDVRARESRVDVQPGDADRVVVVPERAPRAGCSRTRTRCLLQLSPRCVEFCVNHASGCPSLSGSTCAPCRCGTVGMLPAGSAREGSAISSDLSTLQQVRVRHRAAARREVVAPQHPRRAVLHRDDRRAGPRRAPEQVPVPVELRLRVAGQHLLAELLHVDRRRGDQPREVDPRGPGQLLGELRGVRRAADPHRRRRLRVCAAGAGAATGSTAAAPTAPLRFRKLLLFMWHRPLAPAVRAGGQQGAERGRASCAIHPGSGRGPADDGGVHAVYVGPPSRV